MYNTEQLNYMGFTEFSKYIENKKICMVANSSMLTNERNLGSFIDSHDIVVRFNSFVINKEKTGTKIDIHATTYRQRNNIDHPVYLRVVCGNIIKDWNEYVSRLKYQKYLFSINSIIKNKEIQDYLKDKKINRNILATTGLNMVLLILYCNTFSEVNLVGFTFYKNKEKDIYRCGNDLVVSAVHKYDEEKKYIETYFKKEDEYIYSLKK